MVLANVATSLFKVVLAAVGPLRRGCVADVGALAFMRDGMWLLGALMTGRRRNEV